VLRERRCVRRERSFPLRERSFPLRERSFPLRERSFPLRERTGNACEAMRRVRASMRGRGGWKSAVRDES
jgi:hypothetical protein